MKKLAVLLLAAALLCSCAAGSPQPVEDTVLLSGGTPETSQPPQDSETAETSQIPEEPAAHGTSGAPESSGTSGTGERAGSISVSSLTAEPGGFIAVRARDISGGFFFTDMFGVSREMLPDGAGGYICLVPVRASCQPGTYSLEINGGGAVFSGVITVTERSFVQQTIEFSDSVVNGTINSSGANSEYAEKINPLKYEVIPQQLWDGAFIPPLRTEYRLTSTFGEVRTYIYTDGTSSDRHMGLDMAVPAGTPVYAPNSGRVLFAGLLQLTGNSVLIEHGFGLKTWYYHMNSLNVSSGDDVFKGQQIGTVGSTGFSTGPHLHFGASVNDIYIDPGLLMAAGKDFFKQPAETPSGDLG